MMTDNFVFVFPGQNSQEVGMGKALAETYLAARKVFDRVDDILGFRLSRLCFEGPEAELNDTINTQVAIFATSIAILESLREAGFRIKPKYVAGHSLGEYTAYAAAGALSFEEGLRLVRERGRLMKKAGEQHPGGMAAILKLDDAVVTEICQQVNAEGIGSLQIANYNSPGQVVISGHHPAVDRGIELALAAKARRALKLSISVASHCELMRVMTDEFRAAINQLSLNLPEIPIVANISAEPLDSLEAIRAEMESQLTESVRWTDSVLWMINHGVTKFIEIGPKDVLTGLIKRIAKDVDVHAVATPEGIVALLEA